MSTRVRELTEAAIIALEAGNDPFSRAFLVEHSVSADELFALAERFALAGRVFLKLIEDLNADRSKAAAATAVFGRAVAASVAGAPVATVAAAGARARHRIAVDRADLV